MRFVLAPIASEGRDLRLSTIWNLVKHLLISRLATKTVCIHKFDGILCFKIFLQILTEGHDNLSFMHEASDVHGVKFVDIRNLHGTFVKQKLDQVEITLEGGPVQRCHVQLWRYVVDIGASLEKNLDTFLAPTLRFCRDRFDALSAKVPLVADEIKRGVPVLV